MENLSATILNTPRELCTIWTANAPCHAYMQLPSRISTTYSCLSVSYLRYRYPFKNSNRVRSRPSSPLFFCCLGWKLWTVPDVGIPEEWNCFHI